MRVTDIDWKTWQPQQRATLLFVIRDGQILLIRKKKGLGAGKINGPGGRIDDGETPRQGAIREIGEELGIRPVDVHPSGQLSFQFVDGLSLHVHVFTAAGYEGTLRETDEAEPLWCPVDRLPYDQMWADDAHWVPLMLQGKRFQGRFTFDGDRMLDRQLEVTPDESAFSET